MILSCFEDPVLCSFLSQNLRKIKLRFLKVSLDLMLKYVFPFIECQCFDKEGVFILWKKTAFFIEIRVLFWPEISALGVFFNF